MTAKKPAVNQMCGCNCGEPVVGRRPNALYVDGKHQLKAQMARRKLVRPVKGRRRAVGLALGKVRVLAALAQSLPDWPLTPFAARMYAKLEALGVREPICFSLDYHAPWLIAKKAGVSESLVRQCIGKGHDDESLWATRCVLAVRHKAWDKYDRAYTSFRITPHGLWELAEAMKSLGGWIPRKQAGPPCRSKTPPL